MGHIVEHAGYIVEHAGYIVVSTRNSREIHAEFTKHRTHAAGGKIRFKART